MPWKNITSMEEIIRFVMLAQTDRFTIKELCEQFGISRKTGYKHLERYAANGLKGLQVDRFKGSRTDLRGQTLHFALVGHHEFVTHVAWHENSRWSMKAREPFSGVGPLDATLYAGTAA